MSTVEKYSVQASISHARPPCEASENTQGQNNSSEKKLDRLFVKNSYIDPHDHCFVLTWRSLKDFLLQYDIKGGSLKVLLDVVSSAEGAILL